MKRTALLVLATVLFSMCPAEAAKTTAGSVEGVNNQEVAACAKAEAAAQAAYEATDYRSAAFNWWNALSLAQMSGDLKLQSQCATNLGALYVEMGDFENAAPMLQTALASLKLSKTADPARERILLFLISCCYVRNGVQTIAAR